jgi:hypothetical protein
MKSELKVGNQNAEIKVPHGENLCATGPMRNPSPTLGFRLRIPGDRLEGSIWRHSRGINRKSIFLKTDTWIPASAGMTAENTYLCEEVHEHCSWKCPERQETGGLR